MTPSKHFLHRNMIREDRDLKVIGGRCFLPSRVIVDVVFHSFCTTLVGENIMMASRHQIFVDGVVDPKPQANPSRSPGYFSKEGGKTNKKFCAKFSASLWRACLFLHHQ